MKHSVIIQPCVNKCPVFADYNLNRFTAIQSD